MPTTRIEKDSLGTVEVPAGAMYGAQTARAVENYPISGMRAHAALIRAVCSGGRVGAHKVSLRASDDDVDVSAIARAFGGGGHRRAAGFTSELPVGELIDAIRAQV